MNEEEQPDINEGKDSNPFSSPTTLSGNEKYIAPTSKDSSATTIILAIFLGILAIVGIPIVFFVVCLVTAIGVSDLTGNFTFPFAVGVALLFAGLMVYGIVILYIRLLRPKSRSPAVNNIEDPGDYT